MRFPERLQGSKLLITDDWKLQKVFGVLLTDLPKAFYCISHDLLVVKLNHYGLSLSALKVKLNPYGLSLSALKLIRNYFRN